MPCGAPGFRKTCCSLIRRPQTESRGFPGSTPIDSGATSRERWTLGAPTWSRRGGDMRPHLLFLFLAASTLAGEWRHYGGGPDQTRYSPLTQITPENVGALRVAWAYDTHDAFDGSEM